MCLLWSSSRTSALKGNILLPEMDGLAHFLAPELMASLNWNDGWSDNHHYHRFTPSTTEIVTSSQPTPNDCMEDDLTLILPDDLLERVFTLLPVTNILRARAVCRRWYDITTSKRFLFLWGEMTSSSCRPWYFMYEDKDMHTHAGLAYDPDMKKWHNVGLPCMEESSGFSASADGLVCFVDNSSWYNLCVCNPMTKLCRKFPSPPEKWFSDYYALSMMADRNSNLRTVIVARSHQVTENYSEWCLGIEMLDMKTSKWETKAFTVLNGWRGGESSVICSDTFYCVLYSTAMVGSADELCRHSLIRYNLLSAKLNVTPITMPCPLTCVKLMNSNGKLVMVGGIGKSGVIKGIGIWTLDHEWQEIARMPNKFFRGFGEFDDVFSSSGVGDLIYIHAFGSPRLLLYDMTLGLWCWAQKCPMVKKHPLHLFTGFCFEPRLDVFP